jgi:hypothetical protein
MKKALAYAIIAAVLSTSAMAIEPGRNDAGEFCAGAEALMQKAHQTYGETVKWTGKSAAGFRYVLMASKDTWTFIMIDNKPADDGDYEACVKASDVVPASEQGGI